MRGLFAAAAAVLAPFLLGAAPGAGSRVEIPTGPVRVEATKLAIIKGRIVEASGGVEVSAPGFRARAERVRYDRITNVVDIDGGVSLRIVVDGEEATLTAASATLDTGTMAGTLRDAALQGAGIVLEGKRISRTQAGTFRVDEARFTPCQCPSGKPSWEITATRVSARPSGVAVLQGGVLRAKGTPVFFMPLGFAPFSSQRATGFLSPQFSTSKAHGAIVTLPFYFAISPTWDITLEPGQFTKRGPYVGTTVRTANPGGRADFRVDWHRDRVITRADEKIPGDPDDYSEHRWFASSRVTQELFRAWMGKARIDLAGDDRYNFDYGVGQLERSRAEFENNVHVERRDGLVGLVAGSTYYQDLRLLGSSGVTEAAPYNSAQTVSRMAYVDASMAGLPIFGRVLYADLQGGWEFFNNISSPQGSFRRGGELSGTPRRQVQHVRFRPALTTPISLFEDGVRAAVFARMQGDASADPLGGDARTRLVPEAGAELRAEWRRTFAPTAETKLQHRVGPVARVRWVPQVIGDDLTSFEEIGSVPREGAAIEIGVSNRLLYRGLSPGERRPVRELFDIVVLERFRTDEDAPEAGETVGNLDLRTGPLRLDLDLALDNATGEVTSAGGRAATRADAPEGVSLEYAFAPSTGEGIHQGTGGGWLKLAELTGRSENRLNRALRAFTIQLGARYDFADRKFLARSGGLSYESSCGCWGMRIGATEELDRPEGRIKIGAAELPITDFQFSIDLHPPSSIRRFTSSPGGS